MYIGSILGMVFVIALVQYLLRREQAAMHEPMAREGNDK
jgi:hypothetical protein